jgi:hypothetical protein
MFAVPNLGYVSSWPCRINKLKKFYFFLSSSVVCVAAIKENSKKVQERFWN